MALTLLEAAKMSQDVLLQAVVEEFAQTSDILAQLPFQTINGNAIRYNREGVLPGIGFRGVNEAYAESTGILNPQTESLVIAGGDLDVDKFIVDTQGPEVRAAQTRMKSKALALAWTKTFIKGDSSSEPREFDGLQRRITGSQLIANSTAAGGAPLSLNKLDELIDQVDNPTHLLMNKQMRRLLTSASRNTSIGGYVTTEKNEFGQLVMFYQDLPIVIMDYDNEGNEILPFNEADAAGAVANTTSIYAISASDMMLSGIQGSVDGTPGIRVTDLGELPDRPVYRTRVEWYTSIAVMHGRAAARLAYITNGTVTV